MSKAFVTRISAYEKYRICALNAEKKTDSEIARLVGRSQPAVSKVLRECGRQWQSPRNVTKPGRNHNSDRVSSLARKMMSRPLLQAVAP